MAFLQPHAPRQPVFHAPAVVLLLIAFLVLAHVARTLVPPDMAADWITRFAFIPARYGQPPSQLLSQHGIGGWLEFGLTFFSYMALHADYTHLTINCLWLLAFGPIVARRFGTGLFLLFFVLCGLAGALTYLACNWGSADPVIGASGAISGLMPAAIRLLPTQRPAWNGSAAGAPMLPLWSAQMLGFSVLWVALNLVAIVAPGIMGLGSGGLIAWQAHLGGYAAGLLLSGLFDRLRPQPVGEPL